MKSNVKYFLLVFSRHTLYIKCENFELFSIFDVTNAHMFIPAHQTTDLTLFSITEGSSLGGDWSLGDWKLIQ